MREPSYPEQLQFFQTLKTKERDEALVTRAKSEWEIWLEHPSMDAKTLTEPLPALSRTFRKWRLLETAWDFCDKALNRLKTYFPRERLIYARVLNERGEIEFLSGTLFSSEKSFREALKIRQEEPDASWEELSESHNNLALLLKTKGQYHFSEKHYQKSLYLRKKHAQDNPILYAQSLNNLALLYRMTGRYEDADLLYTQALELRRKTLGADHPTVWETENNIGLLDLYMGRYESAQERFHGLLKRQAEENRPPTPVLAQTQSNLAGLYLRLSKHHKAHELFCVAEETCKSVFGSFHFHTLQIQINRASCLISLQKLDQADALLQSTIPECVSRLGSEHLITLTAQVYQGRLSIFLRNYGRAEQILSESRDIVQTKWGSTHPLFCAAALQLGIVQSIAQQRELALETLFQACANQTEGLVRIARAFPESFTLGFLKTLQEHTAILFSFIEQHMPDSDVAAEMGFQMALQRKAVAYEASVKSQERMLEQAYPKTAALFDTLKNARVELAQRTLGEWGQKEEPQAQQARMRELETKIHRLEGAINRQIPRKIDSFFSFEQMTTQSIEQGLEKGEVLVDFLRYPFFELTAEGPVEKEDRYIAFVLRKQETIRMVFLGPAQSIDQKIHQYRSSIMMSPSSTGRFSDQNIYLQSHGRQLFQSLFQPVFQKCLSDSPPEGVHSWVLSPDSQLNLLPFESLILPNGRFLIEEHIVRYVTTSRELLFSDIPVQKRALRKAFLFADPAFSVPSEELQKGLEENNPILRAFQENHVCFEPLHGTQTEIQQITKSLKENQIPVSVFTGREATRNALFSIQSPFIIHIATHGFFLKKKASSQEGPKNHGVDVLSPSFRSGMVMSGINNLIQGRTLPKIFQSPIITSYDIFGIDLFGTELATLSACETGVGEIENGEGVMGLRRAFLTAGAKTLIVSMWKVPDSSTHRLMRQFYRNLLVGMPKSQSLRQAQLNLINEFRVQGMFPSPWEWAGFVCIGHGGLLDWGCVSDSAQLNGNESR